MNINPRSENELERLLANTADTPFTYFEHEFASVQSFLESLKYKSPKDKNRIAALPGVEARQQSRGQQTDFIYWQAIETPSGGVLHNSLLRSVIKRKLREHREILRALLQTGDEEITCVAYNKEGKQLPDTQIPSREVVARIITELRAEFRSVLGNGENLI